MKIELDLVDIIVVWIAKMQSLLELFNGRDFLLEVEPPFLSFHHQIHLISLVKLLFPTESLVLLFVTRQHQLVFELTNLLQDSNAERSEVFASFKWISYHWLSVLSLIFATSELLATFSSISLAISPEPPLTSNTHTLGNTNFQLPLYLLTSAKTKQVLIELKNGETLNGALVNCDPWMNLTLKDVIQSSANGEDFLKIPEIYIRGIHIKYLRLPEEVRIKRIRIRNRQLRLRVLKNRESTQK